MSVEASSCKHHSAFQFPAQVSSESTKQSCKKQILAAGKVERVKTVPTHHKWRRVKVALAKNNLLVKKASDLSC